MTIIRFVAIASALVVAALSGPANAETIVDETTRARVGTEVPEPADFALFAAGVIGLIVGRYTSKTRRPRDK